MSERTVDNYIIAEPLASGGMGEIYRARDKRLGRDVALKFIARNLLGNDAMLKRFEREARAIAALQHPNIVTIYSVERPDDVPFITMELLEGETLRQVISPQGMRLDRLFDVAIPIADALAAVHGRGVIHRDLKPDNIMVTEDGIPKLVDFGLAKFTSPKDDRPPSQVTTELEVSREGAVVGTVLYMSPEQMRGERVDHRSDIYSLGTILFEMAAGHRPFRGASMADILAQIQRDDPPDLTAIRPHLPRQLGRIIELCLQRAVDQRCQSAVDLRNQLVQLRNEIRSGLTPQLSPSAGASVAILPFVDLSAESGHGHIAEGLPEELINVLSGIQSIRTAPRTSAFAFRNQPLSVQKIGETLNVATVLEGSIQVDKKRLVVRAQLISVETGFPLKSFRFDDQLDDFFAIQNEISSQIVKELKGQLLKTERLALDARRSIGREAFGLYLRGRYAYNRRFQGKLHEAINYFKQAIELEPAFAPAYSGLADCFVILGWYTFIAPEQAFPQAKAMAMRALEIDPDLAEAHTSLASVRHLHEWDLIASEASFHRAMELKPDYPICHWWYAFLLMVMGRTVESIKAVDRALELDPLSLVLCATSGWMYTLARQYDRALELLHQTLAMDPTFGLTNIFLGWTLEQVGDCEAALVAWDRAQENMDMPSLQLQRAHTEALSGDLEAARATLEHAIAGGQYLSPCQQASIHVARARHCHGSSKEQELARAFELLERAVSIRDCWLLTLHIDRRFETLQAEPRFDAILARVGATAYKR